jgi:predicted nucleotidyltransferase
MNIHFTDKYLKKQLDLSTIFKIEVGSGMYKLKTPESDTDILCIYLEGSLNLTSITQNHHQFQYKDTENNIDYIYTSLGQFIKNIISGDSTINYEVLQSSEFNNKFHNIWLFVNKLDKINIIKSYLGMAKRDVKMLKKELSHKKAYHIKRGILFAESILNDMDIFETLENMRTHLEEIRNSRVVLLDLEHMESKINYLRESIKDKQFKLNSTDMHNINTAILNVYNEYKVQQIFIDYGTLIEDAVYEEKFNY